MLSEDGRAADATPSWKRRSQTLKPLRDEPASRVAQYRREYIAQQDRLAALWGPEESYTACDEDNASFFSAFYYSWVEPIVLLASKERLTTDVLPPPTRNVRAHECGLRLSRAVQDALYRRNAWNNLVGTEVVSRLDAEARGVLRWIGVPQQGGYTRMMAAVEWSVPPAGRMTAHDANPSESPFFNGVLHGERLFDPALTDRTTLEETTDVELRCPPPDPFRPSSPPKRLGLIYLLFSTLPHYLMWQVPFLLVANFCTMANPLLLQAFVGYLTTEGPNPSAVKGFLLVVSMFACMALQSAAYQRHNFYSVKGGQQFRSALTALIFEKCFTTSNRSRSKPEMNPGRIINMLSSDVERAYFFMMFCMSLWSSPMMLIISLVLLFRLVGWCALMAIVTFAMTLPINAYLMNKQMNMRRQLLKATDARVKATNEFFSGVRIAKFMTWEPRFIANIEAKRAVEVYYIRSIQTIRITTSFINSAAPMVMIAAVFLLYYSMGNEISAVIVFPTIALLGILRSPFQQIPWVLTMTIQFAISMSRISAFLECENTSCGVVGEMEEWERGHGLACRVAAALEDVEITAYVPVKLPFAPKIKMPLVSRLLRRFCCEACRPTKRMPPPTAVMEVVALESPTTASSGSGKKGKPAADVDEFFELQPKVLLRNMNVQVPTGKLTVVVGATGCGKSTLLQTLLAQFDVSHGRVWATRSIAYVPQQPWIMNATLRDNVLFFSEEDEPRLIEALRVSQMETDLKLLSRGLEEEIGEKGINLSGGQKARVSLARAVYADRELYLLDDPLSALDAHVGERVVNECILGKLAGKTRVLATHHLQVVAKADYVIALGDHSVTFAGERDDFLKSEQYREMMQSAAGGEHHHHHEEGDDADGDKSTTSSESSSKSCLDDAKDKDSGDAADGVEDNKAGEGDNLIVEEEKARGAVPLSTYMIYVGYCGGKMVVGTIFAVFVLTEFLAVSGSLWLSLWATGAFDLSDSTYLRVYLLLVILGTAGTPLRFTTAYNAMRRACIEMHRAIIRSVSMATMEFFDRNPMGRIMNRFSRDIDLIDNGLQMSMISMLDCSLSITSSLTVTTISQPLVLLALVPCAYLYYRLLVFYNSANREIRRNTSIMRSPVFSLLGEVTNGGATIAAYGCDPVVMKEALRRLDVVMSCGVLENAANRWLAVRIEFLSTIVVTSIALCGVVGFLQHWSFMDAGLVSLSLTMAMQTTGQLNWFVRQSAAVEADMNSVERIDFYTTSIDHEEMPELDEEVQALERRVGTTDPETGVSSTVVIEASSPTQASSHHISAGSLEFRAVQMRYREGLPLVLRDVSFTIAPREKVGIVGRTGSGKSTLLLTFMRMVDICGGEIVVNGAPIRSFGLRALRRQFSMIPQDPVLFDGTVRLNVDPFLEASSAEVWEALELVGLRERISSESEGIDSRVLEGGSNFSVGQRQLLCMARALLKRGSGFILMDEATANIDQSLDRHIQNTVMKAFAAYTVITIAHRLHTVAQYDKIIVMDHGVVAEMGSPRELVQQRQSVFRGMVESMGPKAMTTFMGLVGASSGTDGALSG